MSRSFGGEFDVLVIGAGHAGCEAALAASRAGASVLMLTHSLENTALMPCNPSIGGPAKGTLVRETDALGGHQAAAADSSAIHLRWLCTSKGPAVRTLRAQCDLADYAASYRAALAAAPRLSIYQAMASSVIERGGRAAGAVARTGLEFRARTVVIACGTYLRGVAHIGASSFPSGPIGQVPSEDLPLSLASLGFKMTRFRTDTTPRLLSDTIDWAALERQESDPEPEAFSFWSEKRAYTGFFCGITRTNAATRDIITASLDRSPLATGRLASKGPRYCPSIDDKTIKFPDRESHPIFLEPVGRVSREIYMQNFSTSMPEDVQIEMIHTLAGCERAVMVRPGYAIEYDVVLPVQLTPCLEAKSVRGLYFAGQICGTSGYEEAAAQGLVAGANAALSALGREPMVLQRETSYIGTLIDDITSRGVDEPYRMLPSRCENRLSVRHDNAHFRLCPIAREAGLLSDEKWAAFERAEGDRARACRELASYKITQTGRTASMLAEAGESPPRPGETARTLMARPGIGWRDISRLTGIAIDPASGPTIEADIKYEGYIERERRIVRRLESMERLVIPSDIDYREISGLSAEASEKLSAARPRTIGDASSVPGITSSDIQLIHITIERRRASGGGPI